MKTITKAQIKEFANKSKFIRDGRTNRNRIEVLLLAEKAGITESDDWQTKWFCVGEDRLRTMVDLMDIKTEVTRSKLFELAEKAELVKFIGHEKMQPAWSLGSESKMIVFVNLLENLE